MAITIVQQTPVGTGGTSATLTFPSNVTAGNAIIVVANSLNGTWSATDSLGNTYTVDVTANGPASAIGAAVLSALNIAGGADTVTVTGPSGLTARAVEVSGLVTAAALDQTATNIIGDTTTGTNPDSGTTAATAQADELVVAVFSDASGANPESITDPTGYTQIYQQTNGVNFFGGGGVQKVVAATGTQDATWTTGDITNWVGCIATFKAAAALAVPSLAYDQPSRQIWLPSRARDVLYPALQEPVYAYTVPAWEELGAPQRHVLLLAQQPPSSTDVVRVVVVPPVVPTWFAASDPQRFAALHAQQPPSIVEPVAPVVIIPVVPTWVDVSSAQHEPQLRLVQVESDQGPVLAPVVPPMAWDVAPAIPQYLRAAPPLPHVAEPLTVPAPFVDVEAAYPPRRAAQPARAYTSEPELAYTVPLWHDHVSGPQRFSLRRAQQPPSTSAPVMLIVFVSTVPLTPLDASFAPLANFDGSFAPLANFDGSFTPLADFGGSFAPLAELAGRLG